MMRRQHAVPLLSALFLGLVWGALPNALASATNRWAGRLEEIRFENHGPGPLDVRAARKAIRQPPGTLATPALLRKSMDQLLETGWFDEVKIETRKTPTGLEPVYSVRPRPLLGKLRIEGLRSMGAVQAAQQSGLSFFGLYTYRNRLSPALAHQAIARLERAYAALDKYDVRISWRFVPSRQQGVADLVLTVQEEAEGPELAGSPRQTIATGQLGPLAKVRFRNAGPGPLNEREAKQIMGLRPGAPLTRATLDQAISDLKDTGWFDEVRAGVLRTPVGIELTLDVRPRPLLESVAFEGLEVLTARQARELAGMPTPRLFARKRSVTPAGCDSAAERLKKAYAARQHPEAMVSWRIESSTQPELARVVFAVAEGPHKPNPKGVPAPQGSEAESLGRLSEIRFENQGPGPLDPRKAQKTIQLRKDKLLTRAARDAAVQQLLATGWFDDVQARTAATGSGTALIFSVAPRPLLNAISFAGLETLTVRQARRQTHLTRGKRISPEIGSAAAKRLMEAYRARYRYDPVVRWRAVPANRAGYADICFTVEEGPRGIVDAVVFSGNAALSSQTLREQLQVKPISGFWARMLGRDAFLVEMLDPDRQAIVQAYHAQGFVQVEVGEPVIHPAGEGLVQIEWPIHSEGPRYRVAELEFQGDVPSAQARGPDIVSLRTGDLFDPQFLEPSAALLADWLREDGHPFAEVKTRSELNASRGTAKVVFDIQAGPRATVRSIEIRGNTRTTDLVIRREIEAEEGATYKESVVAASKGNLLSLGLFDEALVAASGPKGAGHCDLEVDVQEGNTGSIQTGLQYGSEEGAAVVLELRERNFSFRPPFRGDGMELTLAGLWGETRRSASLDWTNPRLGYSPYLLNSGLHFDDAVYDSEGYSQTSYGPVFGTGRAFGRHDRLSLAYQLTQFEVYDVATNASALIQEEEGRRRLGALAPRWTHDQRDHAFRPSQGFLASLEPFWGSAALGGDIDAWGVEARASGYYSPWADHVLNVRGAFRSVESLDDTHRVPLVLRHFLGGATDLRGFEYRSVSPRDAEDNRIGGQTAWWTTVEYTLPVPFLARLDLSTYYDVGDVGPEAFSFKGEGPVSDWGLGLTIRAENFPIRLDLAFPIHVAPNDPDNEPGKGRISFSAGYVF